MQAILIKVYTETDDHAPDIEMFRVFKIEDLLIDPKRKQTITLENGSFYVDNVNQNLKLQTIQVYEFNEIPHYEFWSDKKAFRKKYLPKLIKEGWTELMNGSIP